MDVNLREQKFDELLGMFAQAPIGLCCFDRTLRFLFINDFLAALNGISVAEHLGRSIREVIPDIAEGVEGQLRHVFETGEPIIGGAVDAETPAQPGRIRSFQHYYYAIKFEAGTVSRVACVVQEITAQKQAEEAIDRARNELESRVEERTAEWRDANAAFQREITERKRVQDLYKALLDASPDPVVTVDRDGDIIMINRQVERVLGYGSEDLIGQSVETLLPESLRGRHVCHRNDYSDNPQVRAMGTGLELLARCKDGREMPVEIGLSPVQTTEGSFVTAVIHDVTERKQTEESLRSLSARLITAQEEERSRVARELHDDFNQRLALLAMDIERIHDGLLGPQKSVADDLASLLRRTKELSSDIHRLSHQLHPSVLQHLGLVAAVRSFCNEISEQHDLRIDLAHHRVPRSLPSDVALCLYRIVQEALRNVVKHSGADSARVKITKIASELKLQISDNGIGFDPDGDQTRHGLGLLSMRERLREVDGTISIARIEPTGTLLDVRIPLSISS